MFSIISVTKSVTIVLPNSFKGVTKKLKCVY